MLSRKKSRIIYTSLLIFFIVVFWAIENFYTPGIDSNLEDIADKTEVPLVLRPTSTTSDIIEHRHYVLSYNEDYEQAEWVAYILKKGHLTSQERERPYFIEDPKVRTKSADWKNYKNSGYDRGHLCPAGDRRFSEFAYDETFYTSNITPMNNDFNAGVWNRLELQIRYWGKKYDSVFVVTGGILKEGLNSIGEEDVAIPDVFYKIVAKGPIDNMDVAAFLIPHEESHKPLRTFMVPVDRIEQLTGIDFFKEMPDSIENRLEAEVNVRKWKF